MRTGSASVPEVGRAGAKEAEPACGGPSRYSMVSVPSRHGSGLDVVLSSEGFVVRSCSSTITVLPVIYELKSRRDNVILVSARCHVSHRSINDPSNVIDGKNGLTRRIYIYVHIFFKYAQFEIVWMDYVRQCERAWCFICGGQSTSMYGARQSAERWKPSTCLHSDGSKKKRETKLNSTCFVWSGNNKKGEEKKKKEEMKINNRQTIEERLKHSRLVNLVPISTVEPVN